jgi:hypothetical protein
MIPRLVAQKSLHVPWDGDVRDPSAYLPDAGEELDGMIRTLMSANVFQGAKPWSTEALFRSMARIRGLECGAASGLAEAFHTQKFVVGT